MAYEILRPQGTPVGWGSGTGSVFGAAPQWADDNDSSGASRSTAGSVGGGVAALLPTLTVDPSLVVGITAWVRMSSTAATAVVSLGYDAIAADATYIIDFSQDPGEYWFDVTPGSTLARYDLTALHTSVEDGRGMLWVAAQLAAGGVWISAKPPNGATITVVDLAVVVEYEAVEPYDVCFWEKFERGTLGNPVALGDTNLTAVSSAVSVAGRTGLGMGPAAGESTGSAEFIGSKPRSNAVVSVDWRFNAGSENDATGSLLPVLDVWTGTPAAPVLWQRFDMPHNLGTHQFRWTDFLEGYSWIVGAPTTLSDFGKWWTVQVELTGDTYRATILNEDGTDYGSTPMPVRASGGRRIVGITAYGQRVLTRTGTVDNMRFCWVEDGSMVRQWPNDAGGLTTTPRVFPPPRRGRTYGGHH